MADAAATATSDAATASYDVRDGVFSARHRWLTLGLVLSVSVIAFDGLAASTVMPVVARDLGGLALYGWAFSAFLLTSLIGTTVVGNLADRYGLPGPYLLVMATFAAGLAISGVAPSMPLLILGRAVQGFGGGGVMSVAYVTIGRGYPEPLRPRMFAIISSAWVVPSLVGPGIAGLLAEHVSWRLPFLGLLPLLPLAIWSTLPRLAGLRLDAGAGQGGTRLGTALLVAASAAAFLTGLDVHKPLLAALLVAAGLATGVPALRRLLPAGTLRARRGLPAVIALRALVPYAYFGVEAFVALAMNRVRHSSATIAGAALSCGALGWTLGAWLQARAGGGPWLAAGSRRVLLGIVMQLAGMAGVALVVLSDALPPLFAAPFWALAGTGMGLVHPTLNLLGLQSASAGEEGAAAAAMQAGETLFVAIAAGVGGALVSLGDARGWPARTPVALHFAGLGAVYVLCLFIAPRIAGTSPAGRRQPPPP